MQRYICVSRPRRFGKSMAANMLSAYYSRECDSEKLFEGLEISKESGFKKHLNQYDTIFLNMQEFLSRTGDVDKLIDRIKKLVIRELKAEHPDVDYFDDTDPVSYTHLEHLSEEAEYILASEVANAGEIILSHADEVSAEQADTTV